jgi:Protein of unknown function (DUF1064).
VNNGQKEICRDCAYAKQRFCGSCYCVKFGYIIGFSKTECRGYEHDREQVQEQEVGVGRKTFDSQREARRYQELRWLLRTGVITDLKMQVPFELIPSQSIGGKVVERPVKYVADFVYTTEDGLRVVEDVKSPATRTPQYIIKRKLMLQKFGIRVREV